MANTNILQKMDVVTGSKYAVHLDKLLGEHETLSTQSRRIYRTIKSSSDENWKRQLVAKNEFIKKRLERCQNEMTVFSNIVRQEN